MISLTDMQDQVAILCGSEFVWTEKDEDLRKPCVLPGRLLVIPDQG